MSVTVQPLTWSEIDRLQEGASLYVINNSDMNRKQPRGEVHLAIQDGDQEVQVPIPNTWVPINLVEHVKLSSLKASVTLRTLLRGQVLVAISNARAEELLSSPKGQEEARRVRNIMSTTVSSMIGIQSEQITIDTSAGSKVQEPATANATTGGPSSTIATGIVEEYNNGGDESELIDRLTREFEGGRVDRADLLTAMDNMLNKGSRLYLAMADFIEGSNTGTSGNDRVVRAM